MVRRSPPASSRWVAKEWRSAWGVAVAGQAELQAGGLDDLLDVAGVERAAAGAAKERSGGVGGEGDQSTIGLDRGAGDRKDGDEALAAPLAGDAQHVGERGVGLSEREGLGDAQAAAVEEGGDGRVACLGPALGGLVLDGVDERDGGIGGDRAREAGLDPGTAGGGDGGGGETARLGQPDVEALDRRKRAGERAGGKAALAFVGHPGAEV